MDKTQKKADEAEVKEETAAEETSPKTERKKQKGEIASLKAELEKKEAALAEAKDQYLRLFAEYDNFRKRSAKEKEGIYADAYSDCVGNILPILDNLERAGKSENFEAVRKGLELTTKAFEDALAKMGIEEVETETFDPSIHNAVMHVEDETRGDGEIVEVFQKGYKKGDKIIRFAMVKVAN
ncbi:MAG: nucleotide exchange factor GrpE [Clostridia bacterium]|nr:nucleotide exchange factor GrpE [Clostridia bacterium]